MMAAFFQKTCTRPAPWADQRSAQQAGRSVGGGSSCAGFASSPAPRGWARKRMGWEGAGSMTSTSTLSIPTLYCMVVQHNAGSEAQVSRSGES